MLPSQHVAKNSLISFPKTSSFFLPTQEVRNNGYVDVAQAFNFFPRVFRSTSFRSSIESPSAFYRLQGPTSSFLKSSGRCLEAMHANSIFLIGNQFFSMNSSISSFLKTVERKIQQFYLQNELACLLYIRHCKVEVPFSNPQLHLSQCIRSLQQIRICNLLFKAFSCR